MLTIAAPFPTLKLPSWGPQNCSHNSHSKYLMPFPGRSFALYVNWFAYEPLSVFIWSMSYVSILLALQIVDIKYLINQYQLPSVSWTLTHFWVYLYIGYFLYSQYKVHTGDLFLNLIQSLDWTYSTLIYTNFAQTYRVLHIRKGFQLFCYSLV